MNRFNQFVLVLLIVVLNSYGVMAGETVRLAVDEWPPYTSQSMKYNGLVCHITDRTFDLEGIKVEWSWLPPKRVLKVVKTGEFDGTSFWFYNKDREKFAIFSEPMLNSEFVLFHLKSKPMDWKSVDDLKGMHIGGQLVVDYGKDFMAAEKSGAITIERVKDAKLNLRKLLKGRVDIIAGNIVSIYYLMQNELSPDQAKLITHHSRPVKSDPGFLMLSKKAPRSKQLMESFNKGLKKMKESGILEQYLEDFRQGKYSNK